ncbi:MAG: ADP-ribosylglycohydrolase family protein [Victivallaceae bacterium]
MIVNYEKQLYAALLGKVIGVYLGRPFEGWSKADIQKKFGVIKNYVNAQCNMPLVLIDDDISGTLTFIRALADSGLYADTPPDFYGKTWLNYLFENQTILWWGGVGHSTEHTAFFRLKEGYKSPESGSMALNGQVVAEQIGAQIFIDCFGMVAPGRPELAVKLAADAAKVSHDGEAVYAAMVVAAMVSLAFVEKDMNKLLDAAIKFIPADSLIARVHADVRNWCEIDGDWEKTYDRIAAKYGYEIYGGNCHVIPNHALMVMAWSYGQNDFAGSMSIIQTAGWDTDCNGANVGCVTALMAGLENINVEIDYQTPFADRLIIPTAEGTHSCSDVWRESCFIGQIGRRIMNYPQLAPYKNGACFNFYMPNARHGFIPAPADTQNGIIPCEIQSIPSPLSEGYALKINVPATPDADGLAMIVTPVTGSSPLGAYGCLGTPLLYNQMTVVVKGKNLGSTTQIQLGVSCFGAENSTGNFLFSPAKLVKSGEEFCLEWQITGCEEEVLRELALAIQWKSNSNSAVVIDWIDFRGNTRLEFTDSIKVIHSAKDIPGWISNLDLIRGKFSDDKQNLTQFGKNYETGFLVTGNLNWHAVELSCQFKIHAASHAGIIFSYQGCERYYALRLSRGSLSVVKHLYGQEEILYSHDHDLKLDKLYDIKLSVQGSQLIFYFDKRREIRVDLRENPSGGCGFYVEKGVAGFRQLRIKVSDNQ